MGHKFLYVSFSFISRQKQARIVVVKEYGVLRSSLGGCILWPHPVKCNMSQCITSQLRVVTIGRDLKLSAKRAHFLFYTLHRPSGKRGLLNFDNNNSNCHDGDTSTSQM